MTEPARRLLSGRVLVASAAWSLAAQVVPAVVGVVAIPFIVHGLGVERFGVLTLAWMVIGYFGLFDLGLGRAVTKTAAALLSQADRTRIDRVLWTAWYLMLAIGLVSAGLLAVLVPWLVGSVINIPPELRPETQQAFYLLAAAIPIVILTAGFRGLLEAAQQFKLTTLVKVPSGVLTFVAPLVVLPFTTNLAVIVGTLVVIRLLAAAAYVWMCHRVVDAQLAPARFDREAARELIRHGAWMTVSNVVSPLMVNIDRFFVAGFLSIAAVTYYATPFEAVTKLLIIPSAIAAVLFPAFSAAAASDPPRLRALYRRGGGAVFLAMYPIAFVVITFAPDLLQLWLGAEFSRQSATVLRWLSVGVLANSLAALPFALLQGVGRSDITARIHLAEAPLYLGLMVWLIQRYGITGAAIAWCARTTLDFVLLTWWSARQVPQVGAGWVRDLGAAIGFTVLLALGFLVTSPLQKVVLASALVALFAIVAWHWSGINLRRTR